ncbi:hypothetical protein Mth01_22370 [Sphaerimonospora thailandensis]|uniref:Uncharacterized protein n=2 Tax=Sphaerimonospora thailandensis TaxID=795644 RepID=A0A8J3R9R3_9ACTN|nr:hypothetical protein Mth01_22370 [Sphaerimonospora thailandensis]
MGTGPEMPAVPSAEALAVTEEAEATGVATAIDGRDPHRITGIDATEASAVTEATARFDRTEVARAARSPVPAAATARETVTNGAVGAMVSAVRPAAAAIIVTAIVTSVVLVALGPTPVVVSADDTRVNVAEKADTTIVVSVRHGTGTTTRPEA